jgi:transcription antitermination factor NusG
MVAANPIGSLCEAPIGKGELPNSFTQMHWYAAYVCANHEKKAAAELGRRSLECFLPLYESVRRWRDRRVKLEMPLFPGYLFVRFPLQERLRVVQVPGVVRLVGFGNFAAPVPDNEITQIRDVLRQGLPAGPHPYLRTGRRVRVKAGPLTGLEGILVRQRKKLRFVVSVDLIMRSMAVEMDEGDLEPV